MVKLGNWSKQAQSQNPGEQTSMLGGGKQMNLLGGGVEKICRNPGSLSGRIESLEFKKNQVLLREVKDDNKK